MTKKNWIQFNINNTVRVKLTDAGRDLHRMKHEMFWNALPVSRLSAIPKAVKEYKAPVEDKDGFSEWQLWDLMEKFGSHVGMGNPMLFMDMQLGFRIEE